MYAPRVDHCYPPSYCRSCSHRPATPTLTLRSSSCNSSSSLHTSTHRSTTRRAEPTPPSRPSKSRRCQARFRRSTYRWVSSPPRSSTGGASTRARWRPTARWSRASCRGSCRPQTSTSTRTHTAQQKWPKRLRFSTRYISIYRYFFIYRWI